MAQSETIMAVLTAASVLVSIGALVVARSSRDEAGKATFAANAANQIARESNRIATDANGISQSAVDEARAVPTDVAWDEALVAISALQTANPTDPRVPVGQMLAALRTRLMLLIDRLDWDGFDNWIAHESRRGVMLMHEAMMKAAAAPGPLSVDDTLAVNDDFMNWVAAYTRNLRLFRRTGPDPKTMERLAEVARASWKDIAARNGWEEPPEDLPRLVPLDDSPKDQPPGP